ncbi:MAG TPA: amidase [Candidatus Elarobacter sp.]|nr:amidase [Candidatus Elarobacter sp.]
MSKTDHPAGVTGGLSRRAFVGTTVAGLIAATLGADTAESATPRERSVAVPDFELAEMPIAELQRAMASGRFSSRRLCELYLARIAQLDAAGPTLRSVLQINPDALAIADELDRERKAGHVRGPLHGIPVLIKDNIGTHDRMTTAAGSLALAHSIAPRDSFVAERLRAAGAVILGKTNLSEWANFRSTHSSSGWSGMGGQTRNPYALDRSPSGSSSGSGSASSASLCAVAIGTETSGSIVSPASAASLVGIKPTVGLVSRSEIVPISHSQDTAGPMARCVADAAILLGALTGEDARDAATAASRGHALADYTPYLRADGLKGARIGVARKNYFGNSPATDRIVDDAIAAMRAAGATIVDPADIATASTMGARSLDVLLYEFKADVNAYLAGLGADAPVKSLADLIAFNAQNSAREMPYFGQELFERAQEKGPLTDKDYLDALEQGHRRSRAEGIDATLQKFQLDAIVAPTSGPVGLIDLIRGDTGGGGSAAPPAAIAGYPHITVPAGYIFGVPVGVSFIGTAWSEPTLIRLAYAYEQATKVRKAPRFLPTAQLA